jgi:hypothetical protein
MQRSPQEADSPPPNLTVEKTVKPLKTGEKVRTSGHNKNNTRQLERPVMAFWQGEKSQLAAQKYGKGDYCSRLSSLRMMESHWSF